MKNLKIPVKHRVLKLSAFSLIIFLLATCLSAFKSETNGDDVSKRSSKESLPHKNKLQSDLSDTIAEPPAPYATQINPKAIPFVRKYIRAEGARLEKMKVWGKVYFKMYDHILSEYGLPKELKYLSVIESDLIAKAVSRSGAVGPWQIMEEEATRMGLKINSRVDERKNFRKSTTAAAKILKELYGQFNDWTLVIAAYNCGAGRVRQAIRKSGSKNFWSLQAYLPLETRCHVKRFMGTHYIFEGSGGITTMTASEVKRHERKIEESRAKQLQLEAFLNLASVNFSTI